MAKGAEAGYARAFEALLRLHGLTWWHAEVALRSRAGFPDYVIFGDGWHAFCELKAVSLVTGRGGQLTRDQRAFHEEIRRAGGEVKVFTLPTDWSVVDLWLASKTGRALSMGVR